MLSLLLVHTYCRFKAREALAAEKKARQKAERIQAREVGGPPPPPPGLTGLFRLSTAKMNVQVVAAISGMPSKDCDQGVEQ